MHLVVRDVKKFCTCRNCRGRKSVAAGGPNFKFLIFRSCFRLGLKYKFSFETLALAVRDIVQDYSQKNLVTTISSIEWDAEILDTYSYTILHVFTYFSQTTLCRKYVFRNEKTSGNHWKLLYRIYCPNHLNLTGALDPSFGYSDGYDFGETVKYLLHALLCGSTIHGWPCSAATWHDLAVEALAVSPSGKS
jgi:hypothetical protein